jgi:hypothetical protein
MIVLGRVQRLSSIHTEAGQNLAIQVMGYHRGHLSLRPGTQVFLALYPGGARAGRFPELMGTTIHRDSWGYLFRVSMILKDRPGVVNQLLESVAAQGGNVLYLDSSSIEQERYHRVEAIVDFRPLLFEHRSLPPDRLAALVGGILLSDCSDSVVWLDRRPKVKVNPMRSLRRMDEALARIANPQTLIVGCDVKKDGYIVLPPELIDDINHEMQRGFCGHPPISSDSSYLLTSDTKERTFHVHVLSKRQLVLWCAIRHKDCPGALAAITASLKGAKITILTSLNRLEEHLGASWFEAVLACDEWRRSDDTPLDAALDLMRENVARILASVPASYECRVYFKSDEANDAVLAKRVAATRTPLRDQRIAEPLEQWLTRATERLERLERRSNQPGARPGSSSHDSSDFEEPAERRALALGLAEVRRISNRRRHKVFLSIAHTSANAELVAAVRDICKSMDFEMDLVDSTERDLGVRAEIRRRIELSTHFLGVWTDSRWDIHLHRSRRRPGNRNGPVAAEREPPPSAAPGSRRDEGRERRPRPSPWCLWEIAAAEVLARPSRVLIQEGLSGADYEAIYGSQFAFKFVRSRKLDDFRCKVLKALQSFYPEDSAGDLPCG